MDDIIDSFDDLSHANETASQIDIIIKKLLRDGLLPLKIHLPTKKIPQKITKRIALSKMK